MDNQSGTSWGSPQARLGKGGGGSEKGFLQTSWGTPQDRLKSTEAYKGKLIGNKEPPGAAQQLRGAAKQLP